MDTTLLGFSFSISLGIFILLFIFGLVGNKRKGELHYEEFSRIGSVIFATLLLLTIIMWGDIGFIEKTVDTINEWNKISACMPILTGILCGILTTGFLMITITEDLIRNIDVLFHSLMNPMETYKSARKK